ncbi:MAG: DEAD/DEAH box helicase [Luteolibacter sp.]
MDLPETIIASYPGLGNFLTEKTWQRHFGNTTLLRCGSYANSRCVTQIQEHEPVANELLCLSAKVKGSYHSFYKTLLFFHLKENQWKVESSCSCPVGYLCKHSCAFLKVLAADLGESAKNPKSPAVPSQPLLDPFTSAWLRELETAVRTHAAPVKKATVNPKFLAYCIEWSAYENPPQPSLVLRVGTRNKDGSVTIDNSTATADITKPPKYMADSDFRLVTLYRQIERKQGGYYGVKLRGPGWQEFLHGTLEENRLFVIRRSHGYGVFNFNHLQPGPAEKIEAAWQTQPDDSTRPILKFTREHLQLLPIEPPWYLDLSSILIGPVESELPAAVLTAWEKGPTIGPDKIPLLLGRLGSISEKPLPTPTPLKTEARPAHAPQACLHICRRKIGPIYDMADVIIGLPTFRYGDSPALPPLAIKAAPIYTEMQENTRITWPRDAKGEARHLHKLLKSGFIALSDVTPSSYLDSTTRLAVTLPDRLHGDEMAWLDFQESPLAAKLREADWSLEIDPKAGLTAHNASEFFPALEADPDHGIDWFRFDMQFEISGKKLSLIPIIARMIREGFPPSDSPDLPETMAVPCENPEDGFIRFPARRLLEIVEQVCHLFHGNETGDGPIRVDRLAAAGVADSLAIDSSETTRALAKLGQGLKNITSLPLAEVPGTVLAELRPYQLDGYRWLQFLADHSLHGILADDMGLGKTIQTLTHLAAEHAKAPGRPSLVIAPTSVVPNWTAEAEKFTPHLKILTLQGKDRAENFDGISAADIVLTSYPLISRDFEIFHKQDWHIIVLDEAQYIKNPKAMVAQSVCKLKSAHRLCLSGTPMENHLGELWSLMRFLMPGFLGDEKSFNTHLRRPIERERSGDAQLALNRRVSPLILRRTKDQVATDLPEKTTLIHHIDLNKKQTDLYESVRASMDKRVRDAIAAKGLAKSHIIVLDALLKLRQICCHPQLLKLPASQEITESAKLIYLTEELLPTLLEEGRRILLFSQFTSMLAIIEAHLEKEKIPFLKLTGQTQDRATLVKQFQTGGIPIFLISLKAGGTGLNLTAADTVIHYDPWWNPAAENQATDRAHRIGQTKPVFVHKLVCSGTIEDRILDLQKHKSALVEALLSEDTTKLKIDAETLSHLLAPLS